MLRSVSIAREVGFLCPSLLYPPLRIYCSTNPEQLRLVAVYTLRDLLSR